MNFLEDIFAHLNALRSTPVIQEIHPDRLETSTGAQLLALISRAREFYVEAGCIQAIVAPCWVQTAFAGSRSTSR